MITPMKINKHFFSSISVIVFFLSVNSGTMNAQWIPTNLFNVSSVSSLAVIGNHLFAGTAYGLYSTSDTGAIWNPVINTGFPNTTVSSLVVSGTNFFAGTDFGVFLSTDSGASWALDGASLVGTVIHSLAATGSDIFAGTYHGVFHSTDNGTNWNNIRVGLTDTNVTAIAVIGTNIFAGTVASGGNDEGAVFRSTNNGTIWTKTNLPDAAVYTLAVNSTNLLAGTTKGFFISIDSGASWAARDLGLTNTTVASIAILEPNIFAGTDGGGVFLSSNNGLNWKNVSAGLMDSNINCLASDGSHLFAGLYDGGGVWSRPLSEMIVPNSVGSAASPSFSLGQNAPNPFNGLTKIHYSVQNFGHIRMVLSNMVGEKIKTLLDEDCDAGNHDLIISASNLPSGIYMVTMSVGGISKSEKIYILK
jgi:ligand-binding sensor domain-containing protein